LALHDATTTNQTMSSITSAIDATTDPTALLNTQLASALSTHGDAQFWEETISPTTIRNELSGCDPSNPNSTSVLQKGMKWLLASISKGRDVSDFYPHVVKLVGATSLEVRKMVYMYLVQYADHDATTRELSLLSINSFQRGLADSEQLIRALALRVLSSIRIPDILQIQILGVQKCSHDTSPYVRKCAANALAKLAPRCDAMQREMLLQVMKEQLLDKDTSTMVLTSALIAFCELCPERLELLHSSYRKICHLLTDMDEWGQVVIVDLLARYCRRFFREPRAWKQGTAEIIDQERRVQRRLVKGGNGHISTGNNSHNPGNYTLAPKEEETSTKKSATNQSVPNHKGGEAPRKVKRRVITKGFYSDEEDGSTEEEVYVLPGQGESSAVPSLSSAMRQRNILGTPTSMVQGAPNTAFGSINGTNHNDDDADMKHLDPDHQLLLTSAMPLLKSRNAGVVLSVCSLLYYCGISSIRVRSAMGKALVRIHRGRREIQYVVLTSIRVLVRDCPSAFAPFLPDFFVKALDPPFTRLIKVDILVSLALEPAAIEAVLNELRTYIRHGDKEFACAAIRAAGRVAELARIVYDRHGQSTGREVEERQTANRIALDALYGLTVVTQSSDSKAVVGEAVSAMHNVLLLLGCSNRVSDGTLVAIDDPNQVQSLAIRRILILLVNTLSNRLETEESNHSDDDHNGDENKEFELSKVSLDIPPSAVASALWIIGEWLSNLPALGSLSRTQHLQISSKLTCELLRLLSRCFSALTPNEKEQAVHFATKRCLSNSASQNGSTTVGGSTLSELPFCEVILSMGRVDVNPDVKDRARFESALLHASVGLRHDVEGIDERPGTSKLTLENAKKIVLSNKPTSSYLPMDDGTTVDMSSFRFGTLSSLVGHRARGTYLPLPPWADRNSPSDVREPIEAAKEQLAPNFEDPAKLRPGGASGFYADDNDSSNSGSSSGESSSSESGDADSESDSESDDDSSSYDSEDENLLMPKAQPNSQPHNNMILQPVTQQQQPESVMPAFQQHLSSQNSSNDESSSSSSNSSDSSDSDEDYNGDVSSANLLLSPEPPTSNTKQRNGGNIFGASGFAPIPEVSSARSSAMDDLKGLVMAPIQVGGSNNSGPTIESESSAWSVLVRPELLSGLCVKSRYLRGTVKERELAPRGLSASNPCILCVQVKFSNEKSDHKPVRRIKVLPRSSSGPHVCKKILCPAEISELKAGQSLLVSVVFEFASMSNREGDIVGKIEVKHASGGSIPVEIKPSLGELLRHPNQTSKEAFDSMMHRMQGFQRAEASFTKSSGDMAVISKSITTHLVLKIVSNTAGCLDLIGLLPASNDPVLVSVHVSETGKGKIVVGCDHAVAINSILSLVKRALD
jgi:AP-3 complex subunit beta